MNHTLPSKICPLADTNCVKWMWKSNNDPFDSEQSQEWTDYSPDTSASIEEAHNRRATQICINQNYLIDLHRMMQIDINDTHRQRPVKRSVPSDLDDSPIDWRRERFAFKLDPQGKDGVQTSANDDDIRYDGSKFITDWLLTFTNGKLKVKFDKIYPALVDGIRSEGELSKESEETIKCLIDKLEEARVNVRKKTESKRIEHLAKCCAKLFTKGCYLFRVVNCTLQENDRTKLKTLGSYCYLLYNYIGSQTDDYFSVRHRLRQLCLKQTHSSFVFRGSSVTEEKLDKYRQAAGQSRKYFRWSSFVSTSHQRDVGEFFAHNVLYVIELKRAVSNDQFADLCDNTFMPDEKEVLLQPGVRYRVKSLDYNPRTNLQEVHIKIAPSYIWRLR
jgi:hypothetical protein